MNRGPDANRFSRDVAAAIQTHAARHGTRGEAVQSQSMLDFTVERLLWQKKKKKHPDTQIKSQTNYNIMLHHIYDWLCTSLYVYRHCWHIGYCIRRRGETKHLTTMIVMIFILIKTLSRFSFCRRGCALYTDAHDCRRVFITST